MVADGVTSPEPSFPEMTTALSPAPLGSSAGISHGESTGKAPEGIAAGFTDFHAKFFAHDLLRRHASDSVEKLAAVLADA